MAIDQVKSFWENDILCDFFSHPMVYHDMSEIQSHSTLQRQGRVWIRAESANSPSNFSVDFTRKLDQCIGFSLKYAIV